MISFPIAHYKNLALLDTGCFDLKQVKPTVQKIAEELNLNFTELEGTLDYLTALLQPKWDPQRFLLIPPQSVISDKACRLEGDTYGL